MEYGSAGGTCREWQARLVGVETTGVYLFLTIDNQSTIYDVSMADMQNICQIDAARQVAEQEQVFCQLQERFGVLG